MILEDLDLPSIFTLSNNKIRLQAKYLANRATYKLDYRFEYRKQLITFFYKEKMSHKKCHI